jgi:FixJ family two-component response regulator
LEFFLDLKDITVFIVDDDDSFLRSLRRLISVAGFRTMAFGSAQEFLDSRNYLSNGVLILDVRMPEMGGLDLQKRLADLGADMPIIFMSAHKDTYARQKALEADAFDFIIKPFEEQTLVTSIKKALSSNLSSRE